MTKLGVDSNTNVLEVGCGAGATSVYIAKNYGSKVSGVDLNPNGVQTGTEEAEKAGVSDLASFKVVDVNQGLPFPEETFDVVFCNDTMCHIPNRIDVFQDWGRVLKPGGKFMFTDAMVISG